MITPMLKCLARHSVYSESVELHVKVTSEVKILTFKVNIFQITGLYATSVNTQWENFKMPHKSLFGQNNMQLQLHYFGKHRIH
jgi:hypothetical protein